MFYIRNILTCSHIIILGCLSLPENAEVIEDKDGSGLAYRCVDGYELADDGKCEDVNECDLDKAVSFRWGMLHTVCILSPKTLILFIKLELMVFKSGNSRKWCLK